LREGGKPEVDVAQAERQQAVLNILQDLQDLEGLKRLFWHELNYERENKPLSPRQWPDAAKQPLAEDPILFASGGEGNAFHVVYCRLASPDLSRGLERPVVNRLLRDHPYALFVFSNKSQSAWHFLNVKFDEKADNRRLFRRITVRPGTGLRTATERVQLLDLAGINPELLGITPLAIQQRCDVAFDVEAVTKDFFREIANWYFWALKNVRFPKDAPKEPDGHDHISVIRLITRLIFCWFVKEKGLIPDTLFDERKLAQTLIGFEPAKTSDKESVFYRAILQISTEPFCKICFSPHSIPKWTSAGGRRKSRISWRTASIAIANVSANRNPRSICSRRFRSSTAVCLNVSTETWACLPRRTRRRQAKTQSRATSALTVSPGAKTASPSCRIFSSSDRSATWI
jgi:hypothetical protein